MSGYTDASHAARSEAPNSISIPFVILASILAGLGLLTVLIWLITFDMVLLLGVAPLLAGALMLFSPRAGSDRAG